MATTQQLPVSRVVNVTVSLAAASAALRNFGSCLILGAADVIDTEERLRSYASIDDVAADFGTSALEYQAAALFFILGCFLFVFGFVLPPPAKAAVAPFCLWAAPA